jgi:uncharacterized membrane protein (DUF485 family)
MEKPEEKSFSQRIKSKIKDFFIAVGIAIFLLWVICVVIYAFMEPLLHGASMIKWLFQ